MAGVYALNVHVPDNLATARQLVAHAGRRIPVSSSPDDHRSFAYVESARCDGVLVGILSAPAAAEDSVKKVIHSACRRQRRIGTGKQADNKDIVRLLLIEDDPLLRSTLARDLERAGYAVDGAEDGERGEFLGSTEHYDIAVLDLGLPRLSGLDVLRRWRATSVMLPVIVLTARDEWHERVEGLKAGADDYVGKPFHVEELLARAQALLRRGVARAVRLACGGVELDEEHQSAIIGGARTEARPGSNFVCCDASCGTRARCSRSPISGNTCTDSTLIPTAT